MAQYIICHRICVPHLSVQGLRSLDGSQHFLKVPVHASLIAQVPVKLLAIILTKLFAHSLVVISEKRRSQMR